MASFPSPCFSNTRLLEQPLSLITVLYHDSWFDECQLWLPAGLLLLFVSSQIDFTVHLRYTLGIFPFVTVAAGGMGRFLKSTYPKTAILVGTLFLWSVVSTLILHPHYLSYFNEIAGGPQEGPNYLLDSNMDWGQDLLYLREWLEDHAEARPLHLAYFNIIDPSPFGIEFDLPPFGEHALFPDDRVYSGRLGPRPGYYALSVNFFGASLSGHRMVAVACGQFPYMLTSTFGLSSR
jgi:hypothetical protein